MSKFLRSSIDETGNVQPVADVLDSSHDSKVDSSNGAVIQV